MWVLVKHMENPRKKFNYTKQILILYVVLSLILASWLTGHILRHSIPELQNPHPTRMPGEKIGGYPAYSPKILGSVPITNLSIDLLPG